MIWFLISALAIVAVLALLALVVLTVWLTEDTNANEAARIEWEVQRAERRLHDVASDAFAAMLEEARTDGGRR